ncbi:MAG: hypothetical protein JSR46_07510, partial [Verrucomicrobia bacterium]|nr:hypothetical protein [Verrucomicrobiota bacterium]
MKPAFTAQVIHTHAPAADVINFVEGYCSALHSALGFRVQQYRQVDEKHIVPVSAPEKTWAATAAKIAAIASLALPLIPLCLLAVRWAYRNCHPLTIQPPAYAHLDKHCYLKEANEIRNIRENGVPNGELFKKIPHHFRHDLPADALIADLYPSEEQASPYSFGHLFKPKGL